MLSGPGLSDKSLFAHALGQQGLTQGVVDLVRAGMGQVFPLEVDFGPATVAGQVFSVVEGGGTSGVVMQQTSQFTLEFWIRFHLAVSVLQVRQRGHQGFRHKFTTVIAKTPPVIGQGYPLASYH